MSDEPKFVMLGDVKPMYRCPKHGLLHAPGSVSFSMRDASNPSLDFKRTYCIRCTVDFLDAHIPQVTAVEGDEA